MQCFDEVDKESKESTENDNATTSNEEDKGSGNDRMTRVLNLLNSKKINMSKSRRVNFRIVNVTSDIGSCNTFGDGGADTCLAGKGFTFTLYTDRMALVQGFDDELSIGEKKIGTCVGAYDMDDGTTVLLCLNETIEHTSQENTMLSLNQMRHHGVDVCDIQPKFKRDGITFFCHSIACDLPLNNNTSSSDIASQQYPKTYL